MLFGNIKGNWGVGMRPEFSENPRFSGLHAMAMPAGCRQSRRANRTRIPHAADPRRPVHSELIIKSRFIGCVQPMSDRAGAQKVVGVVGAASGARHVLGAACGRAVGGGGRRRAERHRRAADARRAAPPGPGGRARHRGALLRRREAGRRGLVRATRTRWRRPCSRPKVPIVCLATLRCVVPYAMEGLRREPTPPGRACSRWRTAGGGAVLQPARGCRRRPARPAEAGQGRIEWIAEVE